MRPVFQCIIWTAEFWTRMQQINNNTAISQKLIYVRNRAIGKSTNDFCFQVSGLEKLK